MSIEKQIFKMREADFPFESRSELRSLIPIIRSPRPSIIWGKILKCSKYLEFLQKNLGFPPIQKQVDHTLDNKGLWSAWSHKKKLRIT